MNKETIEKAAMEYAANATPSYNNGDFDHYAIADSFERGAQWSINSVWHLAGSIMPEAKPVLVEYSHLDGGHGYLVVDDPGEFGDSITRFAYLDDLLPERKEATHD